MPAQAIKDWLELLQSNADARDIEVDTDISGRIFHFELGEDPGVIGKVRYSEEKARNYVDDQGRKFLWHRYDRETEQIEEGSDRKVVNVTLDVYEKDEFDPDEHHFIFLTEEMIDKDTYSQGDQKIYVVGEGAYDGPLSKYVDDWEAIFQYASGSDVPNSETVQELESVGSSQETGPAELPEDTSGQISSSTQEQVEVSEKFKQAAFEIYDGKCVLSGIETPELLTVSHVLDRASNPEIAEDIANVIILDWTHHMAFDAGLWTFDESGRLWVKPDFETASESLARSLVEKHGQKFEQLSGIKDEYIEEHNDGLDWWPPR